MPDLMTLVERIDKFSNLLLKMTREPDNKKFWEMNEEFENERRCDDLEDELEGMDSFQRDQKKCDEEGLL